MTEEPQAAPIAKQRGEWLLQLMRAQIKNKDAEALARYPFPRYVILILLVASLLAFPFINERYTTAVGSADPDRYPGLLSVLVQMARDGYTLTVGPQGLEAGKEVPAEQRFGKWLVICEPAGGAAESVEANRTLDSDTNILYMGKQQLAIVCQESGARYDGNWHYLQGFSLNEFLKRPAKQYLEMVLYSAATVGLTANFLGIYGLMLIQLLTLAVIMGFLLSLTKVHAQGTSLGNVRGVGFMASWKTVIGVSVGPALFLAVFFIALPGVGGLSWMFFSLLYAARVVIVYMARFKNKKKPGKILGR